VSALLDTCLQYMMNAADIEYVARLVLATTITHQDDDYDKFIRYLLLNGTLLTKQPIWTEFPERLLTDLVSSNNFVADEIDIFNGIVAVSYLYLSIYTTQFHFPDAIKRIIVV
jgi:hypothetical protein